MNLIANKTYTDELTPVETVGRRAYRLMESVRSEAGELERVVARLYRCGEDKLNNRRLARERESFKIEAARACVERSAELPKKKKDYEENPLDDQEVIDAARLRVFGSVPE
jgi:uncharacterized protein YdaU (DUF1376 family)